MSQRDQLEEMPILPIYVQTKPNEEIDFGEIQILEEDSDKPVTGRARLTFSPKPRIEFLLPESDGFNVLRRAFSVKGNNDNTLTFPEHTTKCQTFFRGHNDEFTIYTPTRTPVEIRNDDKPISKVTFHLLNWPQFLGPDDFLLVNRTEPYRSSRPVGRVFLQADDWKVTIIEVDAFHKGKDTLRSEGGYLISHVGEIAKQDGSAFSAESVKGLLFALHTCFSFAHGRWSGPQLLVGVDGNGKRVLEEWGLGRLSSGSPVGAISCFSSHHSDFLSDILPGFWNLWQKSIWQKPLHEAIYWYVGASQAGDGAGVDSALLFTQAALELLSWTYCVLDRKMVSEDAFKQRGLKAADKLRILASTLSIPLEIPLEMTSLHSRRGQKWRDSMDAITDLRNGLVHPGKDRDVPDGAYADAWKLSLWYIDMIVLRLCGFNGKYSNRLKKPLLGEVETVPWAS